MMPYCKSVCASAAHCTQSSVGIRNQLRKELAALLGRLLLLLCFAVALLQLEQLLLRLLLLLPP